MAQVATNKRRELESLIQTYEAIAQALTSDGILMPEEKFLLKQFRTMHDIGSAGHDRMLKTLMISHAATKSRPKFQRNREGTTRREWWGRVGRHQSTGRRTVATRPTPNRGAGQSELLTFYGVERAQTIEE